MRYGKIFWDFYFSQKLMYFFLFSGFPSGGIFKDGRTIMRVGQFGRLSLRKRAMRTMGRRSALDYTA
jgi:hypothetical protein